MTRVNLTTFLFIFIVLVKVLLAQTNYPEGFTLVGKKMFGQFRVLQVDTNHLKNIFPLKGVFGPAVVFIEVLLSLFKFQSGLSQSEETKLIGKVPSVKYW